MKSPLAERGALRMCVFVREAKGADFIGAR